MNKKIVVIILCILMILTGCTSKNLKGKEMDAALLTPKEAIEGFFEFYNEKNLKGMNTLTTEKYYGSESGWEFDNLEFIKVMDIIEDTNEENKEIYLRQMKKGQIIDMEKEKSELENVAIFNVKFQVKYKKDGVGSRDSGLFEDSYTLVRKDKDSPWLISSIGN